MLNRKLNCIFFFEVLLCIDLFYTIAITPCLLFIYELISNKLAFLVFIPIIYIDDILILIWLLYRIILKLEYRYDLLGWYKINYNINNLRNDTKYNKSIEMSNEIGLLLYLYSYMLIFVPYLYIILADFPNKTELFNNTIFQMYIYNKLIFYTLYNLSFAFCILFVISFICYRCCCHKCFVKNNFLKSNKVYDVTYTKRTIKSSRMFSV